MNAESTPSEIDHLAAAFFRAVSFEEGALPPYENLHDLFIEAGLLIRLSSSVPEVDNVAAFIQPRMAMVLAGELTRFREWEISATTQVFGNVAHRYSAYGKAGVMRGVAFQARGMISTQFARTAAGWRITAMAWDDERPGLAIPPEYL